MVMGEIHVIESYGQNGGGVAKYASQIIGREVTIDIVQDNVVVKIGEVIPEIAHRTKYRYSRHFLPHDARAKTLAAMGKSIIEQLAAVLGLDNLAIVPDIGVEDGIQAARMMFSRCWFDKVGTEDGLRAIKRYQRKQHLDGKSFAKAPQHDWTSHYADAFRMMGVAWREPPPPKPKPENIRGIAVNENSATLDELFATTGKKKDGRI